MEGYISEYKVRSRKVFRHIKDYTKPLKYALIARTNYLLRRNLFRLMQLRGPTDFNLIELIFQFVGKIKHVQAEHPVMVTLHRYYGTDMVCNVMHEALDEFMNTYVLLNRQN